MDIDWFERFLLGAFVAVALSAVVLIWVVIYGLWSTIP